MVDERLIDEIEIVLDVEPADEPDKPVHPLAKEMHAILPGGPASPPSGLAAAFGSSQPQSCDFAVIDLETIPDNPRFPTFGLTQPEAKPKTSIDHLRVCGAVVEMTLDGSKKYLAGINPPESWLRELEDMERQSQKPRVGLFEAIDKCRAAKTAHLDELIKFNKMLSVTPEYCRIAAVGFCAGTNPARGLIVGHEDMGVQGDLTEKQALEMIWELIAVSSPLVGFNISAFDLNVIFVRSILLGVPASRIVNTSPYASDVVDVYLKRFGPRGNTGSGPGRLKELLPLYGIKHLTEGMDGGDVLGLYCPEGVEKIREYVVGDVEGTKDLFLKLRGTFYR